MTKPLPPILPCPWPGCKRKPEIDVLFMHEGNRFFVLCSGNSFKEHEVAGPSRKTEALAIKAWNKRKRCEVKK